MLTQDFTGVYDYEREEAQGCAEFFLSCADEYTSEQLRARADKELAHWKRILCPQGLEDFRDEWNKLVPQYPI